MLQLLAAAVLATSAPAAQVSRPRSAPAITEPVTTGFLFRPLGTHGLGHVLFVPPGYDRSDAFRRWPLILFLHGAGECGTDGWKQVAVGLGPAIQMNVADWPFLVLFPQKPDVSKQWEAYDTELMRMVADMRREFLVDGQRIYLTGLSQGGHGTWVLGARHPDSWAALAPICGYGEPESLAADLVQMPIWCFHGDQDKAVPIAQSRALVAAVQAAGGRPRLTEYPGVAHNSWDKAYRTAPLAAWLLALPDDPVRAAYLADPDQLKSARLVLEQTWHTDGGVPGHPSRGTRTLTLERTAAGFEFRLADHHPDMPESRPAPVARSLGPGPGNDLLVRWLHRLACGGLPELPETVPEMRSIVLSGASWHLAIELDGKAGRWQLRRAIPLQWSREDPALRRAVAALTGILAEAETR